MDGTPKEFFENLALQRVLLLMLRADFQLTDTYQYVVEVPLACPITVYGGEQDELATVKNLGPWNLQTSAEYRIRLFSGWPLLYSKPDDGICRSPSPGFAANRLHSFKAALNSLPTAGRWT
jgi:surfactin synthase thioesterase subunit